MPSKPPAERAGNRARHDSRRRLRRPSTPNPRDSLLESRYALGQSASRQALCLTNRAVKIGVYILDRNVASEEIRPDEFRECGAGLLVTPGIAHEPGERTIDIVGEFTQMAGNAGIMVPHSILIQRMDPAVFIHFAPEFLVLERTEIGVDCEISAHHAGLQSGARQMMMIRDIELLARPDDHRHRMGFQEFPLLLG